VPAVARVKRQAATLATVAAAILLARIVDLYWSSPPEFHPGGLSISWLDVSAAVALSLWLGCFVRQFRGRAILPFTIRSSMKRSVRSSIALPEP